MSQTASIALCGNYQVENFFDFQTGDHDTETVNSTLALNGNGFVGAALPDEAVRLAVSGTITLGGLSWLPNPPDTFVFPRDLTANAANGDWQKFRFAADSYDSATSSWTVTLQFIDDDCRDPWRADFDGSYCEITVFAGPPRLSLTATDAADGNNHVTAITEPNSNLATIKDLYVAADSSGAGHIDLSALFGPSTLGGNPTGQYLHLSITPTSDPAIDDTYANLLTAGDLDDIALQTTPTVHDFVITAWLDADRDTYYTGGTDPSREIHVHVVTLDSLTVTDDDDTGNTTTATPGVDGEMAYVGSGDDGYAHLCITAALSGGASVPASVLAMMHWSVTQSGHVLSAGTFAAGTTISDVPVKPVDDSGFDVETWVGGLQECALNAVVGNLSFDQECAVLSAAAYHDGTKPPFGWNEINKYTCWKDATVIRAVKAIDQAQTRFDLSATLYYSAGKDAFVLAFRGTRFTSLDDWNNNINQVRPTIARFYAGAAWLADQLSSLFADRVNRRPSAGFWVTGHSLGGGLASAFAMEMLPHPGTTTFNAAGISPNGARGTNWPAFDGTNFVGTANYITSCYIPGEILTRIQDGEVDLPPAMTGQQIASLHLTRPGNLVESADDKLTGRSQFTLHGMESVFIAMGIEIEPDA